MRRKVAILSLALILAGQAGCDNSVPITVRSYVDDVEYRCQIEEKGEIYYSILTKEPHTQKRALRLRGKACCMAVSSKGDLLAIAITPMAGPNKVGHYYLSDIYEIVFIDTKTFKETHRWPVKPPKMPLSKPGEYVSPIHNFRELAFSNNGRMIATCYSKPTGDGEIPLVITVWNTASGTVIREFIVPPVDKTLAETGYGRWMGDLAFSPNGKLIAISGMLLNAKQRHRPGPPYGFMLIWRISDGSLTNLQPKGHEWFSGLCFDGTSTRLACWDWVGEGTSWAKVMVWAIPEGKLLTSTRVKGRVLSITRSTARNAFRVRLEDGSDLYVKYDAKK